MVAIQCVRCKGRGYCGRKFCPIYAKAENMYKIAQKLNKKEFFGSSPPLCFVGYHGYPNVNVGILSPPNQDDTAWLYDAPKYWSKNNFNIKQIIYFRGSLINSRFKSNIYEVQKSSRFLEVSQEISLASKPVDIEVELKKKPNFKLNFSPITIPMGPNAQLKKIRITENPKIPKAVDKVVSDTDLKAREGIKYLYQKKIDENSLSKLLSIGTLGLKKNRKLVPLRWSITCIDDILGKELIREIKNYNLVDSYVFYFGGYLGNYFLVMFFPDVWGYELFEIYLPSSVWNPSRLTTTVTDYEFYNGRKNYAENCGGGYYASRLPVIEELFQLKKQASVLVLRFVTGDYYCPLGVWVVREAIRKALVSKPLPFESKEELIKETANIVYQHFRFDITNILKESKILENIKKQTRLTQF